MSQWHRGFPRTARLGQVLGKGEDVVDQDVDSALLALDLVEQRRHLTVIGMVDLDGDAFATTAVYLLRGFAYSARQLIRARSHGAVLNHGLPQHVLGHWDRRRTGHHPR